MKRIFLLICAALLLLSLSACRSRATAVEAPGAAEVPDAAQTAAYCGAGPSGQGHVPLVSERHRRG